MPPCSCHSPHACGDVPDGGCDVEVEGAILRTPAQISPDGSSLLYYFGTSTTTLRRPITYRRTKVWIEENPQPFYATGKSIPYMAKSLRSWSSHTGAVALTFSP